MSEQIENVDWRPTSDGRKTASTTGNAVMLCRHCKLDFPDCPAINVVFGDGQGHDNVCMCASYVHSAVTRW